MKAAPLEGIRVIDLGHEWACPHAGRLLADFGADVIKVEYIHRLDHMRGARKDNRMYNKHPRFLQLNRNKHSVTLDLKEPDQRTIFEDLVRVSDVVLSNSRPGVLDRLGYGYEELCRLKADIILVSLSAYGQTGPDKSYAGYGGGLEATSGVQSLTAYTHEGAPKRIREIDVTNGIGGAAAIMTALVKRQLTGQGTWVDLSELEVPIHVLIGEHVMEFVANGETTLPVGNRDSVQAPHGCYPCQGDDSWVVIAINTQSEWEAFCEVTGNSGCIADPRFDSPENRMKNHDELDSLVTGWTSLQTKFEVMNILQAAGIAAGPVLDVSDLGNDPHLKARGYFITPSEAADTRIHGGFPFRMSAGGGRLKRSGPELGEGNRHVICELLGLLEESLIDYDDDDIKTDFDVN